MLTPQLLKSEFKLSLHADTNEYQRYFTQSLPDTESIDDTVNYDLQAQLTFMPAASTPSRVRGPPPPLGGAE